jgi:hypothetical protein
MIKFPALMAGILKAASALIATSDLSRSLLSDSGLDAGADVLKAGRGMILRDGGINTGTASSVTASSPSTEISKLEHFFDLESVARYQQVGTSFSGQLPST